MYENEGGLCQIPAKQELLDFIVFQRIPLQIMELSLQSYSFSQILARAILRLKSWRLDVNLPVERKYVLVGAPHTSNWDFLYTMLLKYATGIKLHWIGKDTLFRGPMGSVMRALGGIPVKRHSNNNFVQQIVDTFNRVEELVVAISPEGTRSNTKYWRTGFYYIALGAGVPIALGFVDYREKVVGIGPALIPSGDIRADFNDIKEFYAGKTGKYPDKQGAIEIRPE